MKRTCEALGVCQRGNLPGYPSGTCMHADDHAPRQSGTPSGGSAAHSMASMGVCIDGPYESALRAELRHLACVAGWALAITSILAFVSGLVVGCAP